MSAAPTTIKLHYQPAEHYELAKSALGRMTAAHLFDLCGEDFDEENPAKEALCKITIPQILTGVPREHRESILKQIARCIEWDVFCETGDVERFSPVNERPQYDELQATHHCVVTIED